MRPGLFAFLLTLAFASPVFAGDPCPIEFAVVDVGVPEWAKPELKAKVKDGDRFVSKLIAVAKKQDCTGVVATKRTGDELPLKTHESVKVDLRMKTIAESLYGKNRSFRCKDAGKKLRPLFEASYNGAPVLVLRGHRRILVVVAGWRSVCVDSDKADQMSDAEMLKFWNDVTQPYVADRHANP